MCKDGSGWKLVPAWLDANNLRPLLRDYLDATEVKKSKLADSGGLFSQLFSDVYELTFSCITVGTLLPELANAVANARLPSDGELEASLGMVINVGPLLEELFEVHSPLYFLRSCYPSLCRGFPFGRTC